MQDLWNRVASPVVNAMSPVRKAMFPKGDASEQQPSRQQPSGQQPSDQPPSRQEPSGKRQKIITAPSNPPILPILPLFFGRRRGRRGEEGGFILYEGIITDLFEKQD